MSQDRLFCFRDKIIFCNIVNYLFLKFQTAVYFVAVKASICYAKDNDYTFIYFLVLSVCL